MSDLPQIIEAGKLQDRASPWPLWTTGFLAACAWGLGAVVTVAFPDVVPWGATQLFALLLGAGALILLVLSFVVHRLGSGGHLIVHYGPWLIALGLWFTFWEISTAKLGWLPKPFFSPPQGLLNVYVVDWQRLLLCIAYTLRLWAIGFGSGIVVGYIIGVALGWSPRFSYWGMPVLKLIGPVPATAWIPAPSSSFRLPSRQAASSWRLPPASPSRSSPPRASAR